MAHFANVVDGVVTGVIVADQEFIDAITPFSDGEWIQTSYNTYGNKHPEDRPLRKNFAGVGFLYDRERDAFIPPKPFDSWVLDEETCLWKAPKAKPNDGNMYDWSEEAVDWVLI